MSAFPYSCNIVHSKKIRSVLNQKLQNDFYNNSTDEKKQHQCNSVLLKHENENSTHVMENFVKEPFKKHLLQLSDFKLNENLKLNFANLYCLKAISIYGTTYNMIKDNNSFEKLEGNLNTPQRISPISINNIRSSIDLFNTNANLNIEKLTHSLTIFANNG